MLQDRGRIAGGERPRERLASSVLLLVLVAVGVVVCGCECVCPRALFCYCRSRKSVFAYFDKKELSGRPCPDVEFY